jgi:hypothetical protein
MIYVWVESRDSVSSYIDTISLFSIFVILDIPQVNRHWAFSEWWKTDHFWSFLFSIVSISHYPWFFLFVARSTHSVISRLMLFVTITVFNVDDVFVLIMKSIELLLLWIHLISIISRLSYDWRRLMTSIIRRFSWVVLSLTKQSYRDFESMQRISEMLISNILLNVLLITTSMSKLWVISYNSAISTLRVTRLHLMNDQCMILTWLFESARHMTYSIWDERSCHEIISGQSSSVSFNELDSLNQRR